MMNRILLLGLIITTAGCALNAEQVVHSVILPEQRTIDVREPWQLPAAKLPDTPAPRTVSNPRPETPDWYLSLDEAIRIGLENARVVRVLTGLSATSSGRTIYDAAISNTTIDQESARFDPVLSQNNRFNHTDTPNAVAGFFDPLSTTINSFKTDEFRSELGLTKTNILGGQTGLNWVDTVDRFSAPSTFPLNPQNRSALEFNYTQPLLQGAGTRVNLAPIVIARINTERSYFDYKDSVQELVRGIIEAYWNLVQSRTDAWARRIQVEQSESAYQREEARLRSGLADLKNVAQARVTFTQFKAALIAADAAVLSREGALRNIMGLPPEDCRRVIPVSAPTHDQVAPDWCAITKLAEQRRPDIIQLKLVLEAENQRLIQAENTALPRLDAVALYRWNGLNGVAPNGERLATGAGQFNDWSLGVNFSVPLGLRQGRALVRQSNLLIARDKANVDQAVYAAVHELASTLREVENAFEQYKAYKESRAAAYANLIVQIEQFRAEQSIYLNVLQALNDWGSAVSNEARTLLSYNIALATLERQTGTILETHGLVFFEERFRAAGPLLLPSHDRDYPSATFATGKPQLYPGGTEPSENSFDLKKPDPREPQTPIKVLPPKPLSLPAIRKSE